MVKVTEGNLVEKILNQGQKLPENENLFVSDEENELGDDMNNVPNKENELTVPEFSDEVMDKLVQKLTKNVAGTMQALLVTDRITAAEQSSADWRNMCHLMANNPELINNSMLTKRTPNEMVRAVGPDFDDLSKVN